MSQKDLKMARSLAVHPEVGSCKNSQLWSQTDTMQSLADAASLVQNGILDKHRKYQGKYKEGDLFWGLGIEHEFYLETGATSRLFTTDIYQCNKPERYSVRYNTIYNPILYKNAIEDIALHLPEITIPILYNAYTWQKTDICGNHITNYSKKPRPNPAFLGKTIHSLLAEKSGWLRNNYEQTYTYDGDAFEIMTTDFYKTTVDKCMCEYQATAEKFVSEISTNGIPVRIMRQNYPFAMYNTNPGQIAMFNNGTIHFNITLPTRLNNMGKIQFWNSFVENHRNLARAIQWLEPLWVAMYGVSDPLAASKFHGDQFSAASQRCAVSRYIGIGTYDTATMPRGKLLQADISSVNAPWYTAFYNRCGGYARLPKIGMDLNFNKHPNHGLELRFFEQLTIAQIRNIWGELIHLADFSLGCSYGGVPDIRESQEWQELFVEVMQWGQAATVSPKVLHRYATIFGIDEMRDCRNVEDLYYAVKNQLLCSKGNCCKVMLAANMPAPVVEETQVSCGFFSFWKLFRLKHA